MTTIRITVIKQNGLTITDQVDRGEVREAMREAVSRVLGWAEHPINEITSGDPVFFVYPDGTGFAREQHTVGALQRDHKAGRI